MSLNEKLADLVHEIEEDKRPLAWSLGRTGVGPTAIPG
jgi:hypothetical protein